ncbi:MAG: fused MFS/spermidine synthase [Polyangiaceae bacterium]|nr:fused MFS/spermidine synthase [Polyangiaceae bacterium]
MTDPAPRTETRLLFGLFFLSGMTALTAEVVLGKLLSYVFGSSHLATSTVLAAYMGGLSAGSLAFGRWVGRARSPIAIYAWLELAVGVFYGALPLAFGAFRAIALAATSSFRESPGTLTLVRFSLSFALVFAPTFLMGGTLPTLVAAFRSSAGFERRLSALYAVNTLGAAAGALLASYAAIPLAGLDGTLFLASGINVLVAVVALRLPRGRTPDAQPGEVEAREVKDEGGPRLGRATALGFAATQGVLSFSLQVVWFHLIGCVIGVTVYAFSIMLSVILLGIGAGSLLLPRLRGRLRASSAVVFGGSAIVMGVGVALSLLLWDRFPDLVDTFPRLRGIGGFFGRELLRLGYCIVLLGPTTMAMGVALPALAAAARRPKDHDAAGVGAIFSANTVGTILGSLGTGFFLVGRVSSESLLRGFAVALIAVGALALVLARRSPDATADDGRTARGALALGACAVALALLVPGFDIERLTRGNHYYWRPSSALDDSPVVAHIEDAQSGYVTVTKSAKGRRVLKTNGKYEGSSDRGEFQDLFALIGALYIDKSERAGLVGIGPARTLRVLHEMPFAKIDAVEFSPAILELARREFPEFASGPFNDAARVRIVEDDGRNFLQLSRDSYDLIAVAITGAAFAGAGNVYSREFFEVVRARLGERGVFLTWIQIHDVDPADVRSAVRTVRAVFPHVHFYADRIASQGFIVASARPLSIDRAVVASLEKSRGMRAILKQHRMQSMLELVELSLYTSDDELDRYFESAEIRGRPQVYSDLKPDFEYSTPYGLARRYPPFDYQKSSSLALPVFSPPLPEGERAGLEGLRFMMAKNPPAALESLRKAKKLTRSTKFDEIIRTLEDPP